MYTANHEKQLLQPDEVYFRSYKLVTHVNGLNQKIYAHCINHIYQEE